MPLRISNNAIRVKDAEAIEKMRVSNRIVAMVLEQMKSEVRPGISTLDLDRIAEEIIRSAGATPSFKNYHGYPASICTSLDDVVIHGIPRADEILREGSIVSIDVGAYIGGYHGDGARTYTVGEASPEAKDLILRTKEAFFAGMAYAKAGGYLYEISAGIQKHAKHYGLGIVKEFVGHGIGTEMHEEPPIPNYKPFGRGPRLEAGMTLAVEPMITRGSAAIRILDDGWTVVTCDGSLSAHYENTILITAGGYEILTRL